MRKSPPPCRLALGGPAVCARARAAPEAADSPCDCDCFAAQSSGEIRLCARLLRQLQRHLMLLVYNQAVSREHVRSSERTRAASAVHTRTPRAHGGPQTTFLARGGGSSCNCRRPPTAQTGCEPCTWGCLLSLSATQPASLTVRLSSPVFKGFGILVVVICQLAAGQGSLLWSLLITIW